MSYLASSKRTISRPLNRKKTIGCLQSLFILLSCAFGCIGLWTSLYLPDTFGGYDHHSSGVEIMLSTYTTNSIYGLEHETKFSVLRNNSSTSFGFVMSEFACRVLSRHITSSNILVVAPGAILTAKEYSKKNENSRYQNSVGDVFLQYATSEGHAIHAIESESKGGTRKSGPNLDSWWKSFDEDKRINDTSRGWWSSKPLEKPNWILLAVFDLAFGSEDSVWKEAKTFLEDCTVTYFVVAIHSMKRIDGSYEIGGMKAMESLLRKKYKVQVLSSSHYHADVSNERDIFERYGPNALFQSAEEITNYLRWGADAAQQHEESKDTVFTSYIFATQGLDLAIPTPQHYLRQPGTTIDVFDEVSMRHLPALKSCPQAHRENINFVFSEAGLNLSLPDNKTLSYSIDDLDERTEEFALWMDGNSLAQSEAVCIKNSNGLSKCNTRISKRDFGKNKTSSNNSLRPNLLLILLDPISRPHFDRSMRKTNATLAELDFIRFEKYTAVGPNSGPNQAALYSGTTLAKRDQLRKNLKSNDEWLWDRLGAAGYVTLKGEDSCIENSNMMQSLAPNTTHGSALHGLFCFDAFSRPNCIGPDLASTILMEYGHQFISTYEKMMKATDNDLRWASFLHFVDSHEDTMLLSATLDPGLSNFLKKLDRDDYLENSVVIVSSDHGLHYGPRFSTPQGRKEATEPILFIRLPKSLKDKVDMDALHSNAHRWTTPFDLHETLLELTQTASGKEGSTRQGLPLTKLLPQSRKECITTTDLIPPSFCDFQANDIRKDNADGFCQGSTKIPSIDSFFLDISPANRRPRMNLDADCPAMKTGLDEITKFGLCKEIETD